MLKALVAIGGNSLIRAGQRGTLVEQLANCRVTAKSIVSLMAKGWDVVVTHGNGPQVGASLIRSERGSGEVYTHTLDMCVATTQCEIGYLLQSAFEVELEKASINKKVVVIPTRCRVNKEDKAFQRPSKPIGPFYSLEQAQINKARHGWEIVEDASRGWRRVVASPEPVEIVELEYIKEVVAKGYVVIALGGGGVPVIRQDRGLVGVDAVIDKDISSAILAAKLEVNRFIISTDTDRVYIDYKKQTQRGISNISITQLQKYYDEGQFPAGSMGPKVESVIRFMKSGGKDAIITAIDHLAESIDGNVGTQITR